jgi:hypothetical protein
MEKCSSIFLMRTLLLDDDRLEELLFVEKGTPAAHIHSLILPSDPTEVTTLHTEDIPLPVSPFISTYVAINLSTRLHFSNTVPPAEQLQMITEAIRVSVQRVVMVGDVRTVLRCIQTFSGRQSIAGLLKGMPDDTKMPSPDAAPVVQEHTKQNDVLHFLPPLISGRPKIISHLEIQSVIQSVLQEAQLASLSPEQQCICLAKKAAIVLGRPALVFDLVRILSRKIPGVHTSALYGLLRGKSDWSSIAFTALHNELPILSSEHAHILLEEPIPLPETDLVTDKETDVKEGDLTETDDDIPAENDLAPLHVEELEDDDSDDDSSVIIPSEIVINPEKADQTLDLSIFEPEEDATPATRTSNVHVFKQTDFYASSIPDSTPDHVLRPDPIDQVLVEEVIAELPTVDDFEWIETLPGLLKISSDERRVISRMLFNAQENGKLHSLSIHTICRTACIIPNARPEYDYMSTPLYKKALAAEQNALTARDTTIAELHAHFKLTDVRPDFSSPTPTNGRRNPLLEAIAADDKKPRHSFLNVAAIPPVSSQESAIDLLNLEPLTRSRCGMSSAEDDAYEEDLEHALPPETLDDVALLDINPYQPTKAKPGSAEKQQVLSDRYVEGLPLWHDGDNYQHGSAAETLKALLYE